MGVEQIGVAEVRRIVLAAQGFGVPRPARVGLRQVRAAVQRLGVLQIDSVNVLCRSHYLPSFSRLGPYPRSTLDRMAWGRNSTRELFEYFWGHRAALLPVGVHPFLRWRMQAAGSQVWSERLDPNTQVPSAVVEGMQRLSRDRPDLVDAVLDTIRDHGPSTAAGVQDPSPGRGPATEGGRMWNWKDTKIAVEALFAAGRLSITDRQNFERVYDLTERVIPDAVRAEAEPSVEEAQRELVRIAARSCGVATVQELCSGGTSYLALPAGVGKLRVAELIDAGELIPVSIEGQRGRYYRVPDAACPDRIEGQALLSPFDSLIWNRDRIERYFGFRYRISIYLPEPQRLHGYYVLPFLTDEAIVGRVDLRADRQRATLQVPVVNAEPGSDSTEVAGRLADELRLMADWLELERVEVGNRGNLASSLRSALAG